MLQVKKIVLFVVVGMTFLVFPQSAFSHGFEPLFGAYPEEYHPDRIARDMIRVANKYKRGSVALSPFSKELLLAGLNRAAWHTQDGRFARIAARIEALPANMEDPVLSEDQKQQYELFRILIEMPEENTRQAISPTLAQSLSRNVHSHRDRYFRMFSQGGVEQVPDYLAAGLFLHNSVWSTNHSVMMLWLYNFRIPSIRTYLALSDLPDRRGRLTGASSNVAADAAFLLAASESYRMSVDMSFPPPYVMTERYRDDLETQKRLLSEAELPTKEESLVLMRRAAEAQMANLFTRSGAGDALDADRSWYRGSLFAGIVKAWRTTRDDWYLQQAEALSERTGWQPGPNAMHDANDLAISQTYLELYEEGRPNAQYLPTKIILDSLIRVYDPNTIEWSWCDALFMSPPTWARMGKILGEKKYFDHMDKLWWETSELIYDEDDHLFFRDLKYVVHDDGFQIKERNGEKIFWGRGNGWVVGGLVGVLDYLPENFPSRPRYEQMFKEMCAALLKTQGEDGLWRVSLFDPDSYPMGETSASTFHCYAFAWGINRGLLDREIYKPATLKAWKALSACIDPETGLLGYVQHAADSPLSPVFRTTNNEYATGAFLLAGAEMLQLLD